MARLLDFGAETAMQRKYAIEVFRKRNQSALMRDPEGATFTSSDPILLRNYMGIYLGADKSIQRYRVVDASEVRGKMRDITQVLGSADIF